MAPTRSTTPVPTHELRSLAVAASADPRTVARALRGEPVRGLAGERVARVLRERGLDAPAD